MSTGVTVYVYSSDLERILQFYEGALGVKPADHGDWRPFDVGGATFALHGLKDRTGYDLDRFNLSFNVEDIDAALARFESAGAKVLRGVSDEAFGRRAIVQDPDGRTVELVQHGG